MNIFRVARRKALTPALGGGAGENIRQEKLKSEEEKINSAQTNELKNQTNSNQSNYQFRDNSNSLNGGLERQSNLDSIYNINNNSFIGGNNSASMQTDNQYHPEYNSQNNSQASALNVVGKFLANKLLQRKSNETAAPVQTTQDQPSDVVPQRSLLQSGSQSVSDSQSNLVSNSNNLMSNSATSVPISPLNSEFNPQSKSENNRSFIAKTLGLRDSQIGPVGDGSGPDMFDRVQSPFKTRFQTLSQVNEAAKRKELLPNSTQNNSGPTQNQSKVVSGPQGQAQNVPSSVRVNSDTGLEEVDQNNPKYKKSFVRDLLTNVARSFANSRFQAGQGGGLGAFLGALTGGLIPTVVDATDGGQKQGAYGEMQYQKDLKEVDQRNNRKLAAESKQVRIANTQANIQARLNSIVDNERKYQLRLRQVQNQDERERWDKAHNILKGVMSGGGKVTQQLLDQLAEFTGDSDFSSLAEAYKKDPKRTVELKDTGDGIMVISKVDGVIDENQTKFLLNPETGKKAIPTSQVPKTTTITTNSVNAKGQSTSSTRTTTTGPATQNQGGPKLMAGSDGYYVQLGTQSVKLTPEQIKQLNTTDNEDARQSLLMNYINEDYAKQKGIKPQKKVMRKNSGPAKKGPAKKTIDLAKPAYQAN